MVQPNFPDHLRSHAKSLNADFIGYIAPGEENILGLSENIPIKEVKINNNVAILDPGEAAISGKFALCSAVIAKKGERLFVMHLIGREAGEQVENFSRISKEPPQVLPVDSASDGQFTVLVYNNPSNPGEVTSFDLWFEE